MSKTFREVIKDIKPNETYKCHVKGMGHIEISCNENNSIIISTPYRELEIKPSYEFKKLRDKVSFDVAFKEYLNGKEIESCYDGVKYKLTNDMTYVKTSVISEWKRTFDIGINEIKGSWYINN